jgi:hypothetical protein
VSAAPLRSLNQLPRRGTDDHAQNRDCKPCMRTFQAPSALWDGTLVTQHNEANEFEWKQLAIQVQNVAETWV